MKGHYFEGKTFVIENYNQKSPFANFLPGVAGRMGIPLWVFYTNRGQGISGYGLQDKNHPIMAFTPANKAYETTPITGFRTFLKVNGKFYEPFKNDSIYHHKMSINYADFIIEEENTDLNIKTKITYFGLPNEPLGGLVRNVEIYNLGEANLDIEMLDGIAEILPSGIQNAAFKSTSNILASWADVLHLEDKLPFFTLRASTGDTSEVKKVEEGNFYFGFEKDLLIKPIVDQDLIFGYNSAKTIPENFINNSLAAIIQEEQVTTNKFACAFIPIKRKLKPKEYLTFKSISGHAKNYNLLNEFSNNIFKKDYIENKYSEANFEITSMIEDVETETAFPVFDEYIKQNYLDNILRGGYPEKIGDTIYHLYSRRHGDLERDYNFFSLAPEYFSQGSGNFRDVCQNRRLDTFIHKEVEDFNIHHFASLIQLDGYNPLSVNGITFTLKSNIDKLALVKKHFKNKHESLLKILKKPFTPGTIVNFVEQNEIESLVSVEEYLDKIIKNSDSEIQASFGEGFWIDHFTYVLDLVESYEAIYPDKMKALLYEKENYLYFDSAVTVRNKKDKLVLNNDNNVRQYGGLIHFDEEKIDQLKMNPYISNWAKINEKRYASNLFVKLLVLVLNKHASLDPDGFGVEMEAEKPGWNDAMNGLPGLLGSGVSESIELLRIVDFLLKYINNGPLNLPREIFDFFKNLNQTEGYPDRVKARETYRESIRFGLKGKMEDLSITDVEDYLKELKSEIEENINHLFDISGKIIPTFLRYEVTNYKHITTNNHKPIMHQNYPLVEAFDFKRYSLTSFLEAPARLLKTSFDQDKLKMMYENIRSSDIYDHDLKMYKTSGCINDESHEIGRIHAFTKGWLERESNFLHMNYKYLLGLLKAGLYEEYYEEIKTNLVCNMDPAVYKRSTLENSSFIATSNNPDASIHGKGFFARLSGSTVETLNMWAVMMTGGKPFTYINNKLRFELKPKLSKTFFKENHTLSFTLLKKIKITYINDSLEDTYKRCDVYKIELIHDGKIKTMDQPYLEGQLALDIREGLYETINIYINRNKEEK